MNKYTDIPEEITGKVHEPSAEYGILSYRKGNAGGISDRIMEELLQQTDEVKLMIISRLTDSMRRKRPTEDTAKDLEAWKKSMEVKRNDIQRQYHLPDDLMQLLGCIPPLTDEETDEAKEAYLREKYGE